MAMVPHSSGDYFMSKITKKVVMCAVLMGASAGQVFSSGAHSAEPDSHRSLWSYFTRCSSCMRNAVNDVREIAPDAHATATAAIQVGKVVATVQGNEKAVDGLDKAQGVLDGALALTQANNIDELLDASKDIVGILDPKDTSEIAGALDKAERVADALKPMIDAAVASSGANPV